MDEGLKRKLVGASVLVVVALVVLPQLSPSADDASHLADSVTLETDVPDMSMVLPRSMTIPMSEPALVAEQSPQEINLKDIKVDTKTLAVSDFDKPILDNTGQSVVWHIQVGSFAKAKNAFVLRDKLRKAGYTAFSALSNDGTYTRVFVGPNTQKQQLQAQMKAIKQTFNLQGQLVVFNGS